MAHPQRSAPILAARLTPLARCHFKFIQMWVGVKVHALPSKNPHDAVDDPFQQT